MSNEDEARQINPFKIIQRGEDTIGPDDDVQFADFSPRIVPSDTPDEEVTAAPSPKGESVMAPARSSVSQEKTEPEKSDTTVPPPADQDNGQPSQNEDGKQTSS